MKEFKKDENGLFICEECAHKCYDKANLNKHIKKYHPCISIKNYYDKWIKEEDDDKCIICNKEVKFNGLYGYANCCSKKCIKKLREKTCVQRYGVSNAYQSPEKKEKIKQTLILKTGVDHNFKDPICREKCKKTWVNNYGVDNPLKSKIIRNKIKNTLQERYGVEYTHQNSIILEKAFKSAKVITQYKNTELYYQGSYELDFLEKYYNKFVIKRGPTIKYTYNNVNKVYHSDFYIQNLNLVIEIKSSWTVIVDIEIEEKKKATIASGYNYIMILDKNYNDFNIVSSS